MKIRKITGLAGCPKTRAVDDIETIEKISIRIVDSEDNGIVICLGTHIHAAKLTATEARFVASLLNDAAARAEAAYKN